MFGMVEIKDEQLAVCGSVIHQIDRIHFQGFIPECHNVLFGAAMHRGRMYFFMENCGVYESIFSVTQKIIAEIKECIDTKDTESKIFRLSFHDVGENEGFVNVWVHENLVALFHKRWLPAFTDIIDIVYEHRNEWG